MVTVPQDEKTYQGGRSNLANFTLVKEDGF